MKMNFLGLVRKKEELMVRLCGLCAVAVVPAWVSAREHPEGWLVYAGEAREGEIGAGALRAVDVARVIGVSVGGRKGSLPEGIPWEEGREEEAMERFFGRWEEGKIVVVEGRRGDAGAYRVAEKLRELGVVPVYVIAEGGGK